MSEESFVEKNQLISLTPEEEDRVNQLVEMMELEDSSFLIKYGANAQKEVSKFSDKVLEVVKTKDAGDVGTILGDLMTQVKGIDVEGGLTSGKLANIPIIGGLFNRYRRMMIEFQKVQTHIDRITTSLESSKVKIIRDMTMLDGLYEKNKQFYDDLNVYIVAGERKIESIRNVQITELKAQVEIKEDQIAIQELNNMVQMVERFEKKIHDLKLSQQIVIQTAPQIKMIQTNNQILAEKIQSSILNTIPLWKSQMILATTLHRQKKALDVQNQVTNATNELLTKNSEIMKQGSIEVAKANERGIVDIETLRKTHENLLLTLEETVRIQEEGAKKRKETEEELVKMDANLKTSMLKLTADKNKKDR